MKTFSKFFNKSGKSLLLMTALVCGLVIAATALVSCDSDSGDDKDSGETTYKIGSTGPAGGIVFYDKGSVSDGWRYLEAAPADLEGYYQWGGYESDCTTGTAIGTGTANTASLTASDHSHTHPAAQAAADYSYGGYDDWFLPSKDELNLMYTNLKEQGLGGTWKGSNYWSSSQGHSYSAWSQKFGTGHQELDRDKNDNYIVRCVRAF